MNAKYVLPFIIRGVEEQFEEPTPNDAIPTFGTPGVLMSVCKRPSQYQPQYSMCQFPSQVGEHVTGGVGSVAFLVKLFNRVRELFTFD